MTEITLESGRKVDTSTLSEADLLKYWQTRDNWLTKNNRTVDPAKFDRYSDHLPKLEAEMTSKGIGFTPRRQVGSTPTPVNASGANVPEIPNTVKRADELLVTAKADQTAAEHDRDQAEDNLTSLQTLAGTQKDINDTSDDLAEENAAISELEAINGRSMGVLGWRFIFSENREQRRLDKAFVKTLNGNSNGDIDFSKKSINAAVEGLKVQAAQHQTKLNNLNAKKTVQVDALKTAGITGPLGTIDQINAATQIANDTLDTAKKHLSKIDNRVEFLEDRKEELEAQRSTTSMQKIATTGIGIAAGVGFGLLAAATTALTPLVAVTAGVAGAGILAVGTSLGWSAIRGGFSALGEKLDFEKGETHLKTWNFPGRALLAGGVAAGVAGLSFVAPQIFDVAQNIMNSTSPGGVNAAGVISNPSGLVETLNSHLAPALSPFESFAAGLSDLIGANGDTQVSTIDPIAEAENAVLEARLANAELDPLTVEGPDTQEPVDAVAAATAAGVEPESLPAENSAVEAVEQSANTAEADAPEVEAAVPDAATADVGVVESSVTADGAIPPAQTSIESATTAFADSAASNLTEASQSPELNVGQTETITSDATNNNPSELPSASADNVADINTVSEAVEVASVAPEAGDMPSSQSSPDYTSEPDSYLDDIGGSYTPPAVAAAAGELPSVDPTVPLNLEAVAISLKELLNGAASDDLGAIVQISEIAGDRLDPSFMQIIAEQADASPHSDFIDTVSSAAAIQAFLDNPNSINDVFKILAEGVTEKVPGTINDTYVPEDKVNALLMKLDNM